MDINRISGYLPGKLVFFLMQVGGSCCHTHTTKFWPQSVYGYWYPIIHVSTPMQLCEKSITQTLKTTR